MNGRKQDGTAGRQWRARSRRPMLLAAALVVFVMAFACSGCAASAYHLDSGLPQVNSEPSSFESVPARQMAGGFGQGAARRPGEGRLIGMPYASFGPTLGIGPLLD